MKYNPAFLTEEELVRQFVVRLTDLELILETIRQNTGNSNQHILVIGPRGIGKTMLVLRAVAEVKADSDLCQSWYPLVFGEESYKVCSPGEFWLEALFHLAEQTQQDRWRNTYLDLKSEHDETRLRERALAQLMDFADELGKRILLIVENMNMLLGEQISADDAWVLRHTLLNEPRLMLLGTATSRFEEFDNMGKAMYELFKIQMLQPLNDEECRTYWKAITGQEPKKERVRPIKILTGGNPRLLTIISTFASKTSFKELMNDLIQLVDEHTEYFRSHLDSFPAIERKVFVALADLWDPVTARRVADAARIDVNKASSFLKRLESRGAVEVVKQRGRKKCYQVAERMYNIYHLMRRRGRPSSRVQAVVNFMIHFYEPEQLVRTTASIAEEACMLGPELRKDHYVLFETILKTVKSEELRDKIIKATPKPFFEAPDIPSSILELSRLEKTAYPSKAEDKPPVNEIDIRARLAEEPEIAALWIKLGDALEKDPDRVQDAESAYRQAIKIDGNNADAWVLLGLLLHNKLERYEEAEAAYRKAIELKPDYSWAWAYLGWLLHIKLGRYEEAEAAYRKAIELEPDATWSWGPLAELLHKELGRYEEAQMAYRKALELMPDAATGWAQLGELLHEKLERYDEAEAAYRKAIELDPDYAWAWVELGKLLNKKFGRYYEAEVAYRKAIELRPDYAWAWVELGELLHEKLGRYEEAEAAYRKAIELEPDYGWAWAMLGRILHEELRRYEEAEACYRKAIDINPNIDYSWVLIGLLLQWPLERYKEAEQAYQKAIELNDKDDSTWELLIELQMDELNDANSALKTAQQYIEKNKRSNGSLNTMACLILKNKWHPYYPQATSWIREAIEKAPQEWRYQLIFASILGSMGKWTEALDAASQFLNHAEAIEEAVGDLIEIFIAAAAAGYAEEALGVLTKIPDASALEPLVVGLEIFLGNQPSTAQEILEVGHDVAKRIEDRRKGLIKAEDESE